MGFKTASLILIINSYFYMATRLTVDYKLLIQ